MLHNYADRDLRSKCSSLALLSVFVCGDTMLVYSPATFFLNNSNMVVLLCTTMYDGDKVTWALHLLMLCRKKG